MLVIFPRIPGPIFSLSWADSAEAYVTGWRTGPVHHYIIWITYPPIRLFVLEPQFAARASSYNTGLSAFLLDFPDLCNINCNYPSLVLSEQFLEI